MATENLTPLRRARIQHAVLTCLDHGYINKAVGVERLCARLGVSPAHAWAIVDGEDYTVPASAFAA